MGGHARRAADRLLEWTVGRAFDDGLLTDEDYEAILDAMDAY